MGELSTAALAGGSADMGATVLDAPGAVTSPPLQALAATASTIRYGYERSSHGNSNP